MCNFKVGDKLVRLESAPNDMWVLGTTPVTVAAIVGLRSVRFVEPETLVGLGTWGTHCYRLYTPELKSEPAQKEQQMNSMVVSDLTPKKQRKLAAVLDSLGYTFDHDLGLAHHTVVRFNAKSYSTNFGGYNTRLDGRVYISATGKKYKAILAEVLAALPVTTQPTLELKVGCKIRATRKDSPFYSEGAVGVWVGNDNVKFANERWCVKPENLVVVPDDTPVTDDKGIPIEVPQVFEVGCTVERTDREYNGMGVGDTSIVLTVEPSRFKPKYLNVTLEDYTGYGKHCTENLKVIKGA